jgi:predicted nucleic-acid-binding Zn-ribbon protein
MMQALECPDCGNSTFEDFNVTSGGTQMTREMALAFAVREGEESLLVSIDCQKCDFTTSRTIVKQ